MNFTLTNGTARQRQWFEDSVKRIRFPLEKLADVVTVTFVDDPNSELHNLVGFTTAGGGTADVKIYNKLDSGDRAPEGKVYEFFTETIAHEIGHIIQSHLVDSDFSQYSTWVKANYPAEWESADWERAGKESMAESFKDMFVPRAQRAFTQRTDFVLPAEKWDSFRKMMQRIINAATHIDDVVLNFLPGSTFVPSAAFRQFDGEGYGLVPSAGAGWWQDIGLNAELYSADLIVDFDFTNLPTFAPADPGYLGDGRAGLQFQIDWYDPPSGYYRFYQLLYGNDAYKAFYVFDPPPSIASPAGSLTAQYVLDALSGQQQVARDALARVVGATVISENWAGAAEGDLQAAVHTLTIKGRPSPAVVPQPQDTEGLGLGPTTAGVIRLAP